MAAATYTFHIAPDAAPDDADAVERALVVRDGFSWGAFLTPMLWFFSHRHWGAGLLALAAVFLLAFILWLAGFGPGTILLSETLLHLLIGFEGASLRRWLLARGGRPAVDVVGAGSHEEAEVKGFTRWLASEARVGEMPVANSAYAIRRRPEPVIGLFPDLEGRRAGLQP